MILTQKQNGNEIYLKTFDWTFNTPYLSPYENIWEIVSNELKQKNIKNQIELIDELETICNKIGQRGLIMQLT